MDCRPAVAGPGVHTILLISGSTRADSTNSALVRTAEVVPPTGVAAVVHPGIQTLPHFNPDLDVEPLPAAVAALRTAIAEADAVLFCTPEYAGTLPGSFKNLLDWTVGGTVLSDKPVAWVNAAAEGRRGGGAHATLATVLGYVQASIVEDACRHVPVPRESVGPDGLIHDDAAIAEVLAALVDQPKL
ncbi:MAG: NADPH-dependent FMN reductase [Jatrophihabitantaceae bacterium]